MGRRLHLYLWSGMRNDVLRRHRFYVHEVRRRVLTQFEDSELEVEKVREQSYAALDPEHFDQVEAGEIAEQRAQDFAGLILELRDQMILGALAGCYHQWDKELRDFVERELSHDLVPENVSKIAWKSDARVVFEVLDQFGWNCRSAPFFKHLDACRLIVNVYKHGKGPSLRELSEKYPQYLGRPLGDCLSQFPEFSLDHEWLTVTLDDFDQLVAAIGQFWQDMPERLFFEIP